MRGRDGGFTLIELVVALGIFAAVVAVSLASITQLNKTRSDDPAAQIENVFATAARHARHGRNGTAWGVYLPYDNVTRVADELVLFSGSSYLTRDAGQDVEFPFDTMVEFTEVNLNGSLPSTGDDHEAVFAPFSGETAQYGTVEIAFVEEVSIINVPERGIPTETR